MTLSQVIKQWAEESYVGSKPHPNEYPNLYELSVRMTDYEIRKAQHDLAVFLTEEDAESALTAIALTLDAARKAGV